MGYSVVMLATSIPWHLFQTHSILQILENEKTLLEPFAVSFR